VFGNENCRWTLLGDAAEVYRSDSRSKILEVLAKANDLMGPAEIAATTDIHRNNVDQLLHQMRTAGEVVQVSRGRYAHPTKEFVAHPKKPKT
jgi:IclR helix-turn-helix domain